MTAATLADETHTVDWPALAFTLATTLRDALALEETVLPAVLARADGRWKGAPATVETRAWRGERIAYCRVAQVRGSGLAIGNLLCVPDPRLFAEGVPLPILGVDLVAVGEREAIVVADLSPIGGGGAIAAQRMAAALDADARVGDLAPIADLPAWARESFSARALAVRAPAAMQPVAADAVHRVVDGFLALATDVRAGPDGARAAHRAHQGYLRRHREEDAGLTLLARIFGNEWAAAYVREILFPDLAEPS